eukprot:4191724-Heterocapsa_arctica.AAC.1
MEVPPITIELVDGRTILCSPSDTVADVKSMVLAAMGLHLWTRRGTALTDDDAQLVNVNHLNVIYKARGGSPMALTDNSAADVVMEEFDVDMASISTADIVTEFHALTKNLTTDELIAEVVRRNAGLEMIEKYPW